MTTSQPPAPVVKHHLREGVFCISIDTERAWGIWDQPDADYFEHCVRLEDSVVSRLLELFTRYEIPATWAVVSRLMERSEDPDRQEEALWHAPGDIAKIRSASPPQDIGTHGFAHIYAHEVPLEEFEADLASASRVHKANGLLITSMVFPRNQVGHLGALKANGVGVFRSLDLGFHITVRKLFGWWAGRAANLLDKFIPLPAARVHPLIHADGLVELPGSMLLMGRNGIRRLVPPWVMLWKARLAMELAVRRGGMFHLWFHPSNFYYDAERQFRLFEDILKLAVFLRENRGLRIRTMADFADLKTHGG